MQSLTPENLVEASKLFQAGTPLIVFNPRFISGCATSDFWIVREANGTNPKRFILHQDKWIEEPQIF